MGGVGRGKNVSRVENKEFNKSWARAMPWPKRSYQQVPRKPVSSQEVLKWWDAVVPRWVEQLLGAPRFVHVY